MLSDTIWWLVNVALALLIVRGIKNGLFSEFPTFFCYAVLVFVFGLVRRLTLVLHPNAYFSLYWYSEFVEVAIGYGIVRELFSKGFQAYPGTARMARFLVSSLFVFALVRAFVVISLSGTSQWTASVVIFERDLRFTQAALLIAFYGLVYHYGISLGRNLGGILQGYSLFVGASVITLALAVFFGPSFRDAWGYLQKTSYLFSVVIWCFALYSFEPIAQTSYVERLELDYQILAAKTNRGFNQARDRIQRLLLP